MTSASSASKVPVRLTVTIHRHQRLFLPPRKSHHLPCAGRSGRSHSPLLQSTHSHRPYSIHTLSAPLCPSGRCGWSMEVLALFARRVEEGAGNVAAGGLHRNPTALATRTRRPLSADTRTLASLPPESPRRSDRVAGRSRPLPGGAPPSLSLPREERRALHARRR